MSGTGSIYLDGLFYRAIRWIGTLVTQRPVLNFLSGFTVADNPATGATDVSVGGADAAPTFGSISLGDGPFPDTGLIKIGGGSGGAKVVLASVTSSDSPLIVYDPSTPALVLGNDTAVAAVNTNVPSSGVINLSAGGSALFVSIDGSGTEITIGVGGVSRIKVDATGIGLFNATPIAKPTITGSRGGNAALADLLTKLALLGLITDGTSA